MSKSGLAGEILFLKYYDLIEISIKIYVQEGSQKGVLKQVLTLAKERKIQVQFVPKQKIEKVVSGAHQGVAAQVAAYQYAELDDLFAAAEAKDEMPFFIYFR